MSYAGKLSNIIGRVVGPDHKGSFYEAIRAEYNPDTETTHVEYVLIERSDPREAMPDSLGELRIADGTGPRL